MTEIEKRRRETWAEVIFDPPENRKLLLVTFEGDDARRLADGFRSRWGGELATRGTTWLS
jgi:hypothetical protein